MSKAATARLVADITQRVEQADQLLVAAEEAASATKRRHKEELAAAEHEIHRAAKAFVELRKAAFAELLQLNGLEQCSLCLQEVPTSRVKLICKVDPQSYDYRSPLKELPDWSKGAELLRICPECMKERKDGSFPFLDLASGCMTSSHSEMARLWFPARLRGEVWEVRCDSTWQPIPELAIQGYFTHGLRVKLVLTVAQRLGWDIHTRANTWSESWQTVREEYADKLAKKRKKHQEEQRRQHYCDRCQVYHQKRCPKRPRQIFGARAA